MKLKYIGIFFVTVGILCVAGIFLYEGKKELCPDAEQTIYDMKIKAVAQGFSTAEYDAVSVRIDLTTLCEVQKYEASKLCNEIYFAQLDALSGIGR